MATLDVAGHDGSLLTVRRGDGSTDLHAIWLRDACTCPECRRPVSNERLVDARWVAPGLTVRSARADSDVLHVSTSDGHEIEIDVRWLIEHLDASDRHTDPAHGRELWDATTPGIGFCFDVDLLGLPHERRVWLDVMHERGVSKLGVHPHGEPGLLRAAATIGPIRPTNYGTVWTVDATIDPVTAVDSQHALRAHTDLPYLDNPPGVQLMTIESDGIDGGHSTFVDGFAVAERIRRTDPAAWRLLTTIDFEYPFIRADIAMRGRAPLVGLHRNGEYSIIRRAPDLVGSPFVTAHDTADLYRAVGLWNDLLDSGEFEHRTHVGPGEVVMWDNHRVLHGRTAFQLGSRGRRVLHGCYVDMDHLRNERVLSHRRTRGDQTVSRDSSPGTRSRPA